MEQQCLLCELVSLRARFAGTLLPADTNGTQLFQVIGSLTYCYWRRNLLHVTLFYKNVQGQMTEQLDVSLCNWFATLQLLDPFVYIATHGGC
jgi:hypothetical protein